MKVAGRTKGKLTAYLLTLAMLLALPVTVHLYARAASGGSGTESDPFIVDTWDDLQAALTAGGHVELSGNVSAPENDAESLTVSDGVTAVLDLKGYTLDGGNAKKATIISPSMPSNIVLYVAPGGNLTVKDSSAGSTGVVTGSYSYGVYVDNNQYPDCVITSFTLLSGTISGNSTGVFVESGNRETESTFTMLGGTISGNSEKGVKTSSGQFERIVMSGGTISGNGLGSYGEGGVSMMGGTFDMSGGTITGNGGKYGGVCLDPATGVCLNMSGGAITGNSASEKGGGVYVGVESSDYNARVAMLRVSGTAQITGNVFGGTITDGAPVGGTPCNVYLTTGTGAQGTANSVVTLLGALEDSAVIGVTATYAATDAVIAQGNDGTNGYAAYTLTESDMAKLSYDVEGYDVVYGNGSAVLRSVTSVNSWAGLQTALAAGGYVRLSGDVNAEGGSALNVPADVTATLDLNGNILNRGLTGASADGYVISVSGALTISDSRPDSSHNTLSPGGKIKGGNSTNGGGVYVASGGSLAMTGGEIMDNTAETAGGGVYLAGGSAFTMSGGTITENSAETGGGVYVASDGTFTMTGGKINYNNGRFGVGVFVAADSTFSVSGKPVISSNPLSGSKSNLYLTVGTVITVFDELEDGASLGVTLATNYSGAFTNGWSESMGSADPTPFFFSDNADRGILLSGNEVIVATPWALLQSKLSAGGSVALEKDVTAEGDETALIVPEGKTVTLDLAGHAISRGLTQSPSALSDGYVIRVVGSLTITDSSATTEKPVGDGEIKGGKNTGTGGGVYVASGGSVTMSAGTICENTTLGSGGGVYLNGGEFTLAGGCIKNNYSKNGGGVFVSSGTFTLNAGSITENNSQYGSGGGVYMANGSFDMNGGSITANGIGNYNILIESTGTSNGGGVYVGGGTFTLNAGSITGNAIHDYDGLTTALGGGVYVGGGTFRLGARPDGSTDVPVIGSNTVRDAASNLYLPAGKALTITGEVAHTSSAQIVVTLASDYGCSAFTSGWREKNGGGDPADVFAFDSENCVAGLIGDEAAMIHLVGSWSVLHSAMQSTGFVRLSDDVAATLYSDSGTAPSEEERKLIVPVGVTVTLDLCGHTVTGNGGGNSACATEDIAVQGSLTLTDSGTTPRYGSWNEDWSVYSLTTAQPSSGDYDVFSTGGVITGGMSTRGGVVVGSGATFIMTGGAIAGNSAGGGGGVYVAIDGAFTMDGGMICGNHSGQQGGGVFVTGGSFELKSGTIAGNAAEDNGGGVFVMSPEQLGTFTMSGGAITGNRVTPANGSTGSLGGGLYVSSDCTFHVSAGAKITDNTRSGDASNVYLASGTVITVDAALTSGASIGVSADSAGAFTSGWTSKMGSTALPTNYFTSDGGCIIALSGSEAVLLTKLDEPEATFAAEGPDSGKLTGLVASAGYTISGAGLTSAMTVNADSDGNCAIFSGLAAGTLFVVRSGDGSTTNDSDAQEISVGKAATPSLTVTQPSVIGGSGSVATTTAHEYSADDGTSWVDCEEGQTLAAGSYLIRVKASGTTLASDAQSVTIGEFDPAKETTPSATFAAEGPDSGKLTGLVANAAYTLSGAGLSETAATADANGVYMISSGLAKGTLSVVKNGDGSTTNDSDVQEISVGKAATPSLTVTQPSVIGGSGSVATTTAHEYSADDGASWVDCEEGQTLAAGSYLIRVKASGTTLASDVQSVTISEYDPSATVIGSGSCGDGVVWELRGDGTLFVTGSGKMADYTAGTAPWYKYRGLIKAVELETGVTHVGSYAFYACGAIRHVSFCGSDVSIGKYAFAYCIALESTSIGNMVSSIDTAGFYACFRLGNLRPEAPSIGARAFELCGIDK